MRTCLGCRGSGERGDLMRVVVADGGEVVVDLAARAFGRGGWVHPRPECLSRAARGGFARAFAGRAAVSPEALFERVRDAAHRRVAGLLASARVSGNVAAGSDAVKEALSTGACRLLVVAADGRASVASLPPAALGRAAVWGDKERLGQAVSRGPTAVVAVLEPGLSAAISRAIALTTLTEPSPSGAARDSTAHVEVR